MDSKRSGNIALRESRIEQLKTEKRWLLARLSMVQLNDKERGDLGQTLDAVLRKLRAVSEEI